MRNHARRGLMHGAVVTAMAVVGLVLSYRRGFEQAAVIAVLVVGLFVAYAVRELMRGRLIHGRADGDHRGEDDRDPTMVTPDRSLPPSPGDGRLP